MQQEKDVSLSNQLEAYKSENTQLKHIMEQYEKNMLWKNAPRDTTIQSMEMEDDEPKSSSVTTQVTVIDAETKAEIMRLKQERDLFINTKVYKETDNIIKMMDNKIHMLSKQKMH